MNVGIDLGCYNVKAVGDTNVIFSSRFEKATVIDELTDKKHIVEYNGQKYRVNSGSFKNELDKSERNNIPLFLFALSKICKNKSCNAVLGLPVSQIASGADKVKETFTKNWSFKVNDEEFNITVNDVKIFPEALGCYFNLPNELRQTDILIVDIGGRTTDLALYQKGTVVKSGTIPSGCLKIINSCRELITSKHPALDLSVEDVAHVLEINKLEVKGVREDLSYIQAVKDNFLTKIIDEIKLKEFPLDTTTVVFTGGGVSLIENSIKKDVINNCVISTDCLFDNAKGFKKVADNLWS